MNKNLQNALVRHFGFFRYIGYEFSETDDGILLSLRPSTEEEWSSEANTEVRVDPNGFSADMEFYVDKSDTTLSELFTFVNKYNEGADPVKLHIADADDAFAVVGTMPNFMGMDPSFHLDFPMSDSDADSIAEVIAMSVFYLKGFMDIVISDFTGGESD